MPSQVEQEAIEKLADFSGCTKARAKQLVGALKEAASDEAVGIVAGTQSVSTSVTDQRVERVRWMVENLEGAPLPNPYELGVILRLAPTQARGVLRNWRARYPDAYVAHMKTLASKGASRKGGDTSKPAYVIQYSDFEVFEYAVDQLRRRGVQQGLKTDPGDLKITVPTTTTTTDESADALQVLGISE